METLSTMTYERDGRVARITLDRPERGNGITLEMPRELAACVERANLDPEVHVIALAGNGSGFCGGYDLVASAEGDDRTGSAPTRRRRARRSTRRVQAANHDPDRDLGPGDRLPDDVAERARLHEPLPLREAGALQGARLLRRRRHRHGALLGPAGGRGRGEDRLPAGAGLGRADDGALGLADRAGAGQAAAADRRLDLRRGGGRVGARRPRRRPPSALDERFEALLERVARVPVNQLVMHKLLVNQALYAQGLHATQVLGTFFDGIARHTPGGLRVRSAGPPRPAGARRSASATSRSATPAARRSRASRSARRRAAVPDEQSRDHAGGAARAGRGQLPRRPRGRAARDRPTSARPGGSSSTSATCIPAGWSTAAPGSRWPTRSPPGRPSATCRRATTSRPSR